ncbi:MAG: hypothetical protein N2109_12015 [Fimbriimonadales bacterium]|nr:hypothetical protein [Fimbriimonadales bacterium]
MSVFPLTRFIYGTTRLGDAQIPFEDRVLVARRAADLGLSFHTSHQYGEALAVIRAALDRDRTRVPKFVFKIGWSSVEEIRGQIELQLRALELDSMDVGQLCLGGPIAEEIAEPGRAMRGLMALREQGLVRAFVLECWPWSPDAYLRGVRNGTARQLVDAFIFYLNPLQRFVTNELWDALDEAGFPIVAMRTVCGGRRPSTGYLQPRWDAVEPILHASDARSWPEFCVRYALGLPQVVATVGASARIGRVEEFHSLSLQPRPLEPAIVAAIHDLHRRWSDEHDRHAEPWSM